MDFLDNLILEEIQNKRLFTAKYNEWKVEHPALTEPQAERIFEYFQNIKGNLSAEIPAVARFLLKFDGVHEPKFRADRIKDVAAYSFKQIIFLLNQYRTEEEGFNLESEDNSDFGKLTSRATPENIEKSKALWYGNRHKVIDEGSLRVYYIPDQKTAVQFGYYLESFNRETNIRYSNMDNYARTWCISVHSNQNLWSNYRDDRTFYFLIDENKDERSEYRMAVIQRDTSTSEKYRITTRKYDNDPQISWEELLRIYPLLQGHEEVFKAVDYHSTSELNASGGGVRDLIQLMTENEHSEYYIPRQDRRDIVNYITRGFNFTKPQVWNLLDPNLQKLYINKITRDNVYIKISNLALLSAMTSSGDIRGALTTRLNNVGLNGVAEVKLSLMDGEFTMGRYNNINSSDVAILRHRNTNKFGLMDMRTSEWYQKNGHTFGPEYQSSAPKLYKNKENASDKFFIVTYSKGGDENANFYCVIPLRMSKNKGYLLTHEAYTKLEPELIPGNLMGTVSTSPEGERDIEEREI